MGFLKGLILLSVTVIHDFIFSLSIVSLSFKLWNQTPITQCSKYVTSTAVSCVVRWEFGFYNKFLFPVFTGHQENSSICDRELWALRPTTRESEVTSCSVFKLHSFNLQHKFLQYIYTPLEVWRSTFHVCCVFIKIQHSTSHWAFKNTVFSNRAITMLLSKLVSLFYVIYFIYIIKILDLYTKGLSINFDYLIERSIIFKNKKGNIWDIQQYKIYRMM